MDNESGSPAAHLLADIHRVRWGVRIAIPFFILLYVPIDRYAFGMTWEQIIYLDLNIFGTGQVIFHVALQRFLQLQKQSRYPSMLALELGPAQDLQQACELSTRLVAEWLGAQAAVFAWLDDERHTIPMCSYGLSQEFLGIGALALDETPSGSSVTAGQAVVLAAEDTARPQREWRRRAIPV